MALLKNITSGSINGIQITGSLDVSNGITGSLFGTASWALNAITASYALVAGSGGGGGAANITGSEFFIPIFDTPNSLITSSIYQSGSFTSIRNATAPEDPNNPDILYVNGDGVDTYNLISAHGNLDNYTQINVQNYNTGSDASSDIVATKNDGDENTGYINMGINSSNYTNTSYVGGANDAYLYSTGDDLYIGNASSGKQVIIFNGGFDADNQARVWVHDQGTISINTDQYDVDNPPSLHVQGPSAETYNLIVGIAQTDSYSQINLTNRNAGVSASADIVATNDLDSEDAGYINMGVNSTGYNISNSVGEAGDAYLYSTGEDLHIGNASDKPLQFFVGGLDSNANRKLELNPNNQHNMTGSLEISGSLTVLEGITGSLEGTASFSTNTLTASYVNPLVQDVQITGSLLISGSQTLTGSLRLSLDPVNNFTFSNTDNVLNYTTTNASYRRWTATNSSPSGAAAIGFLFYNDLNDLFQFYHGSSNNASITPRQSMMRNTGVGGLRLTADSGPIVFHAGSYGTERARFDSSGRLLVGLTTGSTGFLFEVNGSGRFGNNVTVTGSVTATQGFTGSLQGTASWAQNTLTASYADNFTVAGTLTAQTIVVQTITSSTDYVTGSTRFGSLLSNTHQFTGSVSITGSLTSPSITGSLQGTASWANNTISASYSETSAISLYPVSVTGSTIYSTTDGNINISTNRSLALGYRAGLDASNASYGVFLGAFAGNVATNANDSFFSLTDSGYFAENANNSVFIGNSAGAYSTNANHSIFLGYSAGYSSPEANNSFFANQGAGQSAASASNSAFIGRLAGYQAVLANHSRFIGYRAGQNAASASYSTLLGFQVGYASVLANTIGRNNIIVGTGISLPAGRQDSINLGAIIFATGSYFNTTDATSFTGTVGNGRVGINVVNPIYNLDVSGSGNFTNGLTVTGSLLLSSSLYSSLGATGSAATTTTIVSVSTGSYTAGFFDYTVSSGSNSRAGTVMSVWNGNNVQYTDNSTLDIGTTNDVTMSVALSGGSVLLRSTTTAYQWIVKTTYRLI